jgi:hypothetical protein
MSEENAEILRRGFERFNRTGELDLDLFAPDAVIDNSEGVIEPGVHHGRGRSGSMSPLWVPFGAVNGSNRRS